MAEEGDNIVEREYAYITIYTTIGVGGVSCDEEPATVTVVTLGTSISWGGEC